MKKTKLLLVFILIFAAFFRLYRLDSLPISLFNDEVDVGYQAWSLISTGRDYMGHLLPGYIQSLNEWRAPLLMYITAPFVGVLGQTALAVRLPAALMGILNIYLLFQVANKLFKSSKVGIISALLLALSPWHIHYSRAAFEVTLLLSLLLLGVYLFLKQKYYLSLIPFVLTFYTYSTANIFTPLLLIALLLIYRPKLDLRQNWSKLIFPILLSIPLVFYLLSGQLGARFSGISIFSDFRTTENIILQRIEPWVQQPTIERLFNNKVIAISQTFVNQYVQAFSPQYLFLSGDPEFRHSVARYGELLFIILPFLVAGLVHLLSNLSEKSSQLILAWLLLSPIPSALTIGGGTHATRLFIMLPPLIAISAIGMSHLLDLIKPRFKNYGLIIALLLIIINFSSYWYYYSNHYRYLSARSWHYGFDQILTDLKSRQGEANTIYLNNSYEPILIKYAFYTKMLPKDFQQLKPTEFKSPMFSGQKISDKLYIGEINNYDPKSGLFKPGVEYLKQLLKPDDIYLAVQKREIDGDWDWSKTPPSGFKALSVTRDLYQNPLFYLVSLDTK
jgi:4-amino-4-deoxy-L-arabinose transferase-like glycosyltransferase